MYAADGGIFAFGAAGYQGPVGNQGNDIAGMAATPSGNGYWMADDDGDVFAAGDAGIFGNRAASDRRRRRLRRPAPGRRLLDGHPDRRGGDLRRALGLPGARR